VNFCPPLGKTYPKGSKKAIGFFSLKSGVAQFPDVSGAIQETINL
jgi:hypothetical protein